MKPKHYAISLGLLFALLHLLGMLILTLSNGAALGFWLSLHHLQLSYTLAPLNIAMLIAGTVFAGIVGAIVGGFWGWISQAVERRE
jgi:uncharacterized protein (DUF2062 family)